MIDFFKLTSAHAPIHPVRELAITSRNAKIGEKPGPTLTRRTPSPIITAYNNSFYPSCLLPGPHSSPGIDERTNECGEPWEYVPEHHIFHWPDMSSFKDLRTIDLQGLHGDIPKLVLDIANVIIASPNLKAFGLSMHRNSWRNREREEDGVLLMVVKEIMTKPAERDKSVGSGDNDFGSGSTSSNIISRSENFVKLHKTHQSFRVENITVNQRR